MQRHEMIEAMRALGLKGMAGAFDEAVTTGLQRKRTTNEILTDLLRAEAAHRHAASIRYRMTAAKLPVIKDLDAFVFDRAQRAHVIETGDTAGGNHRDRQIAGEFHGLFDIESVQHAVAVDAGEDD